MKATTMAFSAGVLAACGGGPGGASAAVGDLAISHAVAWTAPGDVKAATIGLEVMNGGNEPDTLVSVTSTAGAATIHVESPGSGMRPVPVVPLPRHMATRMGRGLHVMLTEMPAQPKAGATVPVTLRFARAGAVDLDVPVMQYSEALKALGQ